MPLLLGLPALLAFLIGGPASAAAPPWLALDPAQVRVAEYVLVGQWRSWPWPEPYRLAWATTLPGPQGKAFVAALDHLKADPYKIPVFGCPASPSPIYRITVVYSLLSRLSLATDGCIAIGQTTIFGTLANEHRLDGTVLRVLRRSRLRSQRRGSGRR